MSQKIQENCKKQNLLLNYGMKNFKPSQSFSTQKILWYLAWHNISVSNADTVAIMLAEPVSLLPSRSKRSND